MLIQLNVGLQSSKTGEILNALSVQTEVCKAFPHIRPFGISARVQQSATEPTLVCSFEYPDSTLAEAIKGSIFELCAACEQEAIALKCGDTGLVLGPQAAKWGAFNPEFWIEFAAPIEPIKDLTLNKSQDLVYGWEVGINEDGESGWFERCSDGTGGSLTFSYQNPQTGVTDGYLHLIDYDGVHTLPRSILTHLRGLGVECDPSFE